MAGKIVLAPGVFGHFDDTLTPDDKVRLDALHLAKIHMADEVLVVNPEGYIGESCRREILYAESLGKPVSYTSCCVAPLEEAWLKSGLTYEDWIKTTREGQARERLTRTLDKVKKGQVEQEQVKEIVFNKGNSENSDWMKTGPTRGVNKEEEREPENL
jgi:hypothetical protein